MTRIAAALVLTLLAGNAYGLGNCPEGNFGVAKAEDSLFNTFYKPGSTDFTPLKELTTRSPGSTSGSTKVQPWEYVRLPNKEVVSANNYLFDLNAAAKCMALEYGSKLLGDAKLPEEFAEYLQTAQDLARMGQEVKQLVDDIKNFDPRKHAEKFAEDYLKEQLQKSVDLENNPSLKSLYEDVEALKSLGDSFDPIPVPAIPIREDLDSKTYKDWKASFGKPSQILAEMKASFEIRASKTEAQVITLADAFVQIFKSNPIPVLRANGTINAPAKGKVEVATDFWIAGLALKPYKGSVDILDLEDAVDTPIVDVYNQFWFSVGPIPVSVTLGASGSAGLTWGLYANGVSASAKVSPVIKGEAYLEAAADIIIAAIGAGGRLTIIDAAADLKAMANLAFEADGTPYVENKVIGETNLTLLAGDMYTFVEIPVPAPPFVQRFEKSVYNYPGVRVPLPGLAVNFAKKGRPGGRFSVEGEADTDDMIAVDLDNAFGKLMTVIYDDVSKATPIINDETSLSIGYLEDLDRNNIDLSLKLISQWK